LLRHYILNLQLRDCGLQINNEFTTQQYTIFTSTNTKPDSTTKAPIDILGFISYV